jgi:hypothetical protein
MHKPIKGRKISKRKYEKSRQDYETVTAKAKQLGSNKKIDVLKLYATEKEKEKARKIMEINRREYMEYLEDMQAKLVTDVLDMLIASGDILSIPLHIWTFSLIMVTNARCAARSRICRDFRAVGILGKTERVVQERGGVPQYRNFPA